MVIIKLSTQAKIYLSICKVALIIEVGGLIIGTIRTSDDAVFGYR